MTVERSGSPLTAPPSSTGPLALWFAVQLSVLLVAALEIPLAARYPQPAEQLAPHLLLGAQVAFAAMLFPFLLRDRRSAAQVVATTVPFQLAAGYLGGRSAAEMLAPAAFVDAWLLTLALWAACLRSPRARMLGVAVANCLTLGGAALQYLRLEFNPTAPAVAFETASPLLTTLALLNGNGGSAGWVLVGGCGLAAIFPLVVRRFGGNSPGSTNAQSVTRGADSSSRNAPAVVASTIPEKSD